MHKIIKPNQIFIFYLQKTFERAKAWINELREERPSAVIALAGNKTDLAAKRQVALEVSRPNLVCRFVPGTIFTCMYFSCVILHDYMTWGTILVTTGSCVRTLWSQSNNMATYVRQVTKEFFE